jgi:uncharacterized phage protein (TIGR01671 family)
MRELKFRAWDKENRHMIQDSPVSMASIMRDRVRKAIDQNGTPIGAQYVIMQWTGLKDKNGKEIYEGDALRVINPNGEEDNPCIVEWDGRGCCYPYEPQGGYGDYDISSIGWAMDSEFEFEIIGNVHEHTELLGV